MRTHARGTPYSSWVQRKFVQTSKFVQVLSLSVSRVLKKPCKWATSPHVAPRSVLELCSHMGHLLFS
jgi:hypothetical protein